MIGRDYSYIEEGGYNELEGTVYEAHVLLVARSSGWEYDDTVYLKMDRAEAKRLGEFLLAAAEDKPQAAQQSPQEKS